MRLRTRMLILRAGFLVRRANHDPRRRLAAELATYSSESDLNDLYALLDTYPDGQTKEIRQILGGQQLSRSWQAG